MAARDVAIRCGAAAECLRAVQDLESELRSMRDEALSDCYRGAQSVLQALGDKLSAVTDRDLAYVDEARQMASGGRLLAEMRSYADGGIDAAVTKLTRETHMSWNPVGIVAKQAINKSL